jgi:hypothetical protein
MTETQTPNPDCPLCAGTGFIPPFMDACTCEKVAAEAVFVAPTSPIPGEMMMTLDGGTRVWTGTEWKPVKTEALSPAEYAARFPKPHKSGDADFDELMDEANAWEAVQLDEAAEAAALAAAAAVVDEVDAEDTGEFGVVYTTDTVKDTVAAAIADEIITHYSEDAIVAAVADVAGEYGEADLGDVLETVGEIANAAMVAAAEAGEPPFAPVGTPAGDEVGDRGPTFAPSGAKMAWAEPDYAAGYGEAGIYSDPSISYGGSKKKPTGKLMTAAQEALLTRLIAERDPLHPVVAAATVRAVTPLLAREASKLIDALMVVPADPAKKPARQNSYDGICRHCGGAVPAMTGVIHKIDGRWQTAHKDGECLTAEAQATLAAERVDEPGLYKWDLSGPTVIYRVRKSRTSSRLYAEKVTVHDHDGVKTVEFAYNAKAIAYLRKADKLTWLEARDFGAAYGACVACGRTLSDPRSLVQQYGSTCAGHYGWPTVNKKQAEAIINGDLTWEDVIAGLGVLTS